MTPKAIRDAANGPWEVERLVVRPEVAERARDILKAADSLPQEDLGPRCDQSRAKVTVGDWVMVNGELVGRIKSIEHRKKPA